MNTNVTLPRKLVIAAGVLYLITHVTSVGALIQYSPVLNDANYVIGSGSDARVLLGALLETILAFAIIATAVALFPIVKRQSARTEANELLSMA